MTDAQSKRAPRAVPRLTGSQASWRLYLMTSLASLYAVAWWTFTTSLRAEEHTAAAPSVHATAVSPMTVPDGVWLDQLPLSARPSIVLPSGWTLATTRAPPVSRPAVTRVAVARRMRIRTRSS